MTVAHHPTDETLMRYAAGTLGVGPAIVVGAHLAVCSHCRGAVGTFEALGGIVLEETEPTALAADALARAMARIDARGENDVDTRQRNQPVMIGDIRLPDSLAGCEVRRWRWIGPGMHMSRIVVPHHSEANLILLKVGPGRALPDHGHVGTEFTFIISGSYTDALGKFAPGDIAEVDDDVEHQPIVDPEGDCICLAALDGKMRFNSLIGRMLQPIFGI